MDQTNKYSIFDHLILKNMLLAATSPTKNLKSLAKWKKTTFSSTKRLTYLLIEMRCVAISRLIA